MMHDIAHYSKVFATWIKSPALQFTFTTLSGEIEISLDRSLHCLQSPPTWCSIHNVTDGTTFQVNDHHLKPYHEYLRLEVEELLLKDLVYQDWSLYLLGIHYYIIIVFLFLFVSFQLGNNGWCPLVFVRYYLSFTFLNLHHDSSY